MRGIPKRDGSGRGVRTNRGRGGCSPPRNRGRGQKMPVRRGRNR